MVPKSCVHDNHHLLLSSTSSAYYDPSNTVKLTMFEFRMLLIICHKLTTEKTGTILKFVAAYVVKIVVSICKDKQFLNLRTISGISL